jgi:hypothetical protein
LVDQDDLRKHGNLKDLKMHTKSEWNKQKWLMPNDVSIKVYRISKLMKSIKPWVLWNLWQEKQKIRVFKQCHLSGQYEDIPDLLPMQHSKNSNDMQKMDFLSMRMDFCEMNSAILSIRKR